MKPSFDSSMFKLLLLILLPIILIFLVFFTYQISLVSISSNPYVIDLVSNWNQFGIDSIYSDKNNKGNCTPFIQNIQYEGVEPACQCQGLPVYKGKCSLFEEILGCESIDGIPKGILSKWKGAKLCIVQSTSNYFDTITIPPTLSECEFGYKLCGYDTKNFGLCYRNSESCPVNNISIGYKDKENVTNMRINEDWVINYSNEVNENNSKIIVDIKYSEGKVCINPSEKIYKRYHVYDNEKVKLCEKGLADINAHEDERYKHLDHISKFRLLVDNNLYSKIEGLPQVDHQKLVETNVYINYRGYIYWSPQCRKLFEYTPETIIEDLNTLSTIEKLYAHFCKLLATTLIIFFFDLIFVHFNIKLSKYSNIILTLFIISLFWLSLFILTLILYKSVIKISKKLYTIKCGEIITNTALSEIGKRSLDSYMAMYNILFSEIILVTIITVLKQFN